MKRFILWMVSLLIADHENTADLQIRSRYGMLEGTVSIAGNCLLFAVKLIFGIMFNSISVIADAVHTLSDSASSAIVIIGFRIAKKPSDREHPFGHGRMEPVATLIVSVLLFVTSFELAKSSVVSLYTPSTTKVPWIVIAVIAATMAVKELMARFSFILGEIIDSPTLKADGKHHRSDVLTTAGVVIALVACRWEWFFVDGVMGLFVSVMIFYSAYEIFKDAVSPLLGEAPTPEKLKQIETLATRIDGVLGVHDIIIHRYGMTTIISLHIEVSDRNSAYELHSLSETVENEITRETNAKVIIHIDPLNLDHPMYRSIKDTIDGIVQNEKKVASFHDLRITGCRKDRCHVVFDIVPEKSVKETEYALLADSIKEKFQEQFPRMKTFIKVEPKFAYSP